MLPLGTIAPNFTLPDTISGKKISLQNLNANVATVVMFICNHCPFVKHIITELAKVVNEYQTKDIKFVAISANDIENYPLDAPDKMKEFAKQHHLTCPYLYDEDQSVAKAYQAACTPDFYIFNKEQQCVYRGQFDDARPGNHIAIDGKDLRAALDNMLAGKPVNPLQKPSVGCNIKWKI